MGHKSQLEVDFSKLSHILSFRINVSLVAIATDYMLSMIPIWH